MVLVLFTELNVYRLTGLILIGLKKYSVHTLSCGVVLGLVVFRCPEDHFEMDQLKKKMAQLRTERDEACERAEEAERKVKEAKERTDQVSLLTRKYIYLKYFFYFFLFCNLSVA